MITNRLQRETDRLFEMNGISFASVTFSMNTRTMVKLTAEIQQTYTGMAVQGQTEGAPVVSGCQELIFNGFRVVRDDNLADGQIILKYTKDSFESAFSSIQER